MNRPDAILVSEDFAKKYFGDSGPMGKTLRKNNDELLTVTAVLVNVPANSHLQFGYIMPMSAIAHAERDLINNTWNNFNFYTYIQLDERFKPDHASLAALEKQMDAIYKTHVDEGYLKAAFHAQPLTSIHLHSDLQVELSGNGNAQYVNTLFVVAIFILLVACINFMNLSTARSARRAKEVGMRKVVGAARMQLIGQFLGESLLISLLSLLIALVLAWAALPAFNYMAGKGLGNDLFDGKLLLTLIGVMVMSGLVAGTYPALFLSGFTPISVLKGKMKLDGSGSLAFRNTLVVVQFTVSIALLIGTAVVYQQLNYIRNMNIGYDKANLLHIRMKGDMWNKQAAYRSELERNPLTADFAIVQELPTNLTTGTMDVQWEGKDLNSQIIINLDVSERFFDVFQMKMAAGRAFSTDFKGDSANYIINEKLAGIMGFDAATAVGKPIALWDRQGTIVGVVKDFNFKPVNKPSNP